MSDKLTELRAEIDRLRKALECAQSAISDAYFGRAILTQLRAVNAEIDAALTTPPATAAPDIAKLIATIRAGLEAGSAADRSVGWIAECDRGLAALTELEPLLAPRAEAAIPVVKEYLTTPAPPDEVACQTCGGTGTEHSGVCHCGESMDAAGPFAHSGHSPTEMTRPCPDCDGLLSKNALAALDALQVTCPELWQYVRECGKALLVTLEDEREAKAQLAQSEADRERLARELAELKAILAHPDGYTPDMTKRARWLVDNVKRTDRLRRWLHRYRRDRERMRRELAEAQSKTARRCAEMLEREGVLLPIRVGETKHERVTRYALAMAQKIRREFGLDAARKENPNA